MADPLPSVVGHLSPTVNHLSPTVNRLSPSAKNCRAVSVFPAIHGGRRCVEKCGQETPRFNVRSRSQVMARRLFNIGCSRARSTHGRPVESPLGTVTGCHIDPGRWRWKDPTCVAGIVTGEIENCGCSSAGSTIRAERWSSFSERRCSHNDCSTTVWRPGPTERRHTGDTRRQDLGVRQGTGGDAWQGRQWRMVPFDRPKGTTGERLMAICGRAAASAIIGHEEPGAGVPCRKRLWNHDKKRHIVVSARQSQFLAETFPTGSAICSLNRARSAGCWTGLP